MTKTFTFNKENWSGQETTIKVTDDKFELNGHDFYLDRTINEDDELYIENVACRCDQWDEPLVLASKCIWKNKPEWSDKYWTAYDGEIEESNINRTDADVEVAIAKVLFNTI